MLDLATYQSQQGRTEYTLANYGSSESVELFN